VVIYLDASALLQHRLCKPGTDAIQMKILQESKDQEGIFVSVVGNAEIYPTLARLLRDSQLTEEGSALLQRSFQDVWTEKLSRVDLGFGVLAFVPGLVNKHLLKGADAIRLASALWLQTALRTTISPRAGSGVLQFATSEKQLKTAAAVEGLQVFDPLNPV
jgi:hypothetical protein